jgi:hypothetical protein
MKKLRLLVLSDTHCGSVFGLTPNNIFNVEPGDDLLVTATAQERKACWAWFVGAIDAIRPIHRLVLNGDMVEGAASRQQGLELLAKDPMEQIRIAKRIVEFVDCPEVAVIAGTAYHTGQDTDWERLLCDETGGKFGGQDYYSLNGVNFSFKHYIGGSQTPIGRGTPLAREGVWNQMWAAREEFPACQILVRSHVHYHTYFGTGAPCQITMTTPGLQTPGSRYGVRRMSGVVDYGFVYFDVYQDGSWQFEPVIWSGAETAWAQLPIDWS